VPVQTLRSVTKHMDRTATAGFPLWRLRFEPRSGHAGFVVEKWRWSRFCPSTSVSPTNHHLLSSEAGRVSQIVATVPSGFSLTPLSKIIINKKSIWTSRCGPIYFCVMLSLLHTFCNLQCISFRQTVPIFLNVCPARGLT
jgi:hypothetical protein